MQLEKLNGIVWPAIAEELSAIIRAAKEEIVVVEAAILSKAGWEKLCHEVCMCFLINSKNNFIRNLPTFFYIDLDRYLEMYFYFLQLHLYYIQNNSV